MKIARRLTLLILALPALALAQTPSLAERLPRDAYFYILWRGTAAVEANRATNGLLRLWSDPSTAPLRERMEARLLLGARNRSKLTGLTPEELKSFLPLLENQFVTGYAPQRNAPEQKPKPGAAPAAPTAAVPQGAHFFVLDTTGKRPLLAAFLARLRTQGKSSSSQFGMNTIETLELPDGTTRYFAQLGRYFLVADRKELLEDLITRFSVPARLPTLAETPEYQRAQRELGPGAALEAFVHVPDMSRRPPRPGSRFNPGAFFHGLHLERAQVLCAGLTFEPATTRLHAALLGDTSAGSILDAVGPSEPTFLTLAAAPPGASFQVARFDAATLYQDVHDALGTALAPEDLMKIALAEAAIQQQLGMAPEDLLKLLGGEFAAIHLTAGTSGQADLYAVTIRQPSKVLAFLRNTLAKTILGEKQEGTIDLLSLGGGCVSVKPPKDCRWRYSLAVTPGMLLAGRDGSKVEAAVARLDHPAAATLAADPEFASARARLPKELSGLSFSNLRYRDWQQSLAPLAKGVAKEMPNASGTPVQMPDPAVLSRYLHETVSGWWKNPQGIHFTLYVE